MNVTPKSPGRRWDGIDIGAVPDATATEAEINELIALMEYRPGIMAEAMTQCDDVLAYWRGILSFGQVSHPATYDLAYIALRVAEFQAMHYKYKFNRIRPSAVSPVLMPPIDPPGHAAYPSGHATEAYLMAHVLGDVMPENMREPLKRMAQRIARNREVIGVHYPSDSEAGRKLAEGSFPLLAACRTYGELLPAARAEWGRVQA